MPSPQSKARVYSCERCKATLAREDRRRREGERLIPVDGELTVPNGRQAPTLKCKKCGLRTILVEGSL